jgi:hypothetical protein
VPMCSNATTARTACSCWWQPEVDRMDIHFA